MTDSQRVSRFSVKWIEPASVPDKDVIHRLREVLDTLPNVQSTYVVGERNTPDDGGDPFETVGVALVLDPPLTDQPRHGAVAIIKDLSEKLGESGSGGGHRQAWLFVSQATIDARRELVIPIYP